MSQLFKRLKRVRRRRFSRLLSKHASKARHLAAFITFLGLIVSCGSSSPQGSLENPSAPPFQDARSESCTTISGLEALYWDYALAVVRVGYPETIRFLPYAPGIPFIHPQQPLYSFMYPPGWQAFELTDAPSRLTGVNVIRQDNQAIWRYLNFSVPGQVTAGNALDEETKGMLSFIGNPQAVETVCMVESSDRTRAAALIRAGNFTANVNTTVQVVPFLDGFISNIVVQVGVAPTDQYAETAFNVFFPLLGQLTPGGSSNDPQCSDGIDNDGDTLIDYPEDKGCTSRDGDSEQGP